MFFNVSMGGIISSSCGLVILFSDGVGTISSSNKSRIILGSISSSKGLLGNRSIMGINIRCKRNAAKVLKKIFL